MGQEYVKYVTILGGYNATPLDGVLDEFDVVTAFASGGGGTTTITRTVTDVFSGSAAMAVSHAATGAQSPFIKRILPFPQQRYVVMEFSIGARASNVTNKQLTFDVAYFARGKNGRFRFAIQNWDNDVINVQVFNSLTGLYEDVAINLDSPIEGKTFFIVRAEIDTFDRKWTTLDVAGERYNLGAYNLETITEATDPDAVQAARLLITAQGLTNLNTINYTLDKFKWSGTTYPQ